MQISSFQALCLLPEPDGELGIFEAYWAIKRGADRFERKGRLTLDRVNDLAVKHPIVLFGRCGNRRNAGYFIFFGRSICIKADTKKAKTMMNAMKVKKVAAYRVAPTRKEVKREARQRAEAYWRDVRAGRIQRPVMNQ